MKNDSGIHNWNFFHLSQAIVLNSALTSVGFITESLIGVCFIIKVKFTNILQVLNIKKLHCFPYSVWNKDETQCIIQTNLYVLYSAKCCQRTSKFWWSWNSTNVEVYFWLYGALFSSIIERYSRYIINLE